MQAWSIMCAVAALCLGCGGTGGGPADAPGTGDAEDVAARAETTPQEDGVPREDAAPPEPAGAYEVAAFTVVHSCVGCDQVSICGWPPISDHHGVTVDAAPNLDTGVLFAAERWEAAGRGLPLESCTLLEGGALDPVTHPPDGVDVLDAGDLTFTGEMPLLELPMELSYKAVTGNYPSAFRPPSSDDAWDTEYLPGVPMSFDAAGGADWPGWALTDLAPGPIDILAPQTDAAGQIASIPTDQPLEVVWTGAEDFEALVLYLQGYYCEGGVDGISFMLVCHVENDGAFTIPAADLAPIQWPRYVDLGLTISRKIPLGIPGVDPPPAWSLRSCADLPVYHDPDATPGGDFHCAATEMAEGFSGLPCADHGDCGGGCCLPEHQVYFKDNYCSLTGCATDADCPADATCAMDPWEITAWESYCAQRCEGDDECRFPDYACLATASGATACKPNFW